LVVGPTLIFFSVLSSLSFPQQVQSPFALLVKETLLLISSPPLWEDPVSASVVSSFFLSILMGKTPQSLFEWLRKTQVFRSFFFIVVGLPESFSFSCRSPPPCSETPIPSARTCLFFSLSVHSTLCPTFSRGFFSPPPPFCLRSLGLPKIKKVLYPKTSCSKPKALPTPSFVPNKLVLRPSPGEFFVWSF